MEKYKGNKPWVTVFGCLVVFIGLPVAILTYGELDQGDFLKRFFGDFIFALIVLNLINTIGSISFGLLWFYFYYRNSEKTGDKTLPTEAERVKCNIYSLWITFTILFLRKSIIAFFLYLPTEGWIDGTVFIVYLLLTVVVIAQFFLKTKKT